MSSIKNAKICEGKYLTGEFTTPKFSDCPNCGSHGSYTNPDWDVKTNNLLLTGICMKCENKREDGIYVTRPGIMRID